MFCVYGNANFPSEIPKCGALEFTGLRGCDVFLRELCVWGRYVSAWSAGPGPGRVDDTQEIGIPRITITEFAAVAVPCLLPEPRRLVGLARHPG